MKTSKKLIIISLILLSSIITTNPLTDTRVKAQTETLAEIKVVNPLTGDEKFIIHTNATILGKRFNATIWVYNVTDLFAYQTLLEVNETQLNITNAQLPIWDSQWVFYNENTTKPSPTFYDRDHNNSTESVKIGASLLKGEPTFNGTGLLAIIEFEITDAPNIDETISSLLDIKSAYPTDTCLLNSSIAQTPFADIPCTITNGYYEYTRVPLPKPWLEISPTLIQYEYKPPAIGQQFNIAISIKSLNYTWYLINATFSISFNPALISPVDQATNPLWKNKSIYLTSPSLLYASVGNPVTNPSGNVTLITLKFQVEYQATHPTINETILELNNTKLIGYFQEIPTAPPVNGKVVIKGLLPQPWLEVSPQTTSIREVPPSAINQKFNISLLIKNLNAAWELKSASLTLTFNQTLLAASNVTEGTFLPSFGTTTFNHTISQDTVAINQSIINVPTSFPSGEGTIATVTFTIIHQGPPKEIDESNITITQIKLKDKEGNNIPAKTLQGFYQIKSLTSSQITIAVNPSTVKVGSNATISGTVTPAKPNANVTIYYRTTQNETWAPLGIAQTNQEGNYTYAWTTTEAGNFEIKASWPGDSDTQGDESDIITLTVEQEAQFPQALLYTIIGITILIIILMLIYIKKRKH